jgi:phage-related holin
MLPAYFDVFIAPVRDNQVAQAALVGLMLLILMDWIFGVVGALARHEFSSEKMREGIGHKCTELGFVLVGIVSDGLLFAGLDIGMNGPVLLAIVLYLCIMEIGSLLEHFAKMNPALADTPIFKMLASAHVIHDDEKVADHAKAA